MDLIPDLWTVIFQVLNFLAITALLYWLLFKPMMKSIRERAAEKQALMVQIEEDREAAADLRSEWEDRVADAEEEADEILAKAKEEAEQERQAVLEEAQEEAERVLVEAHTDAARVRQHAVENFHDDLMDAVLDISAVVIHQVAPEEMHRAMVETLTDRIWEMGRSEMARVESFRRSLGDRAPTAHVATAQPLSPDLQGSLARTLAALADRNVDLDIEVHPELAVGLRVRLGDIVVENSIVGQLEELRDRVSVSLRDRLAQDE
jgi:F-type H+-transporting ATPase subunit b